MKISKLFHWLYFTVMMLPIFILPIFALAVRSDNNFTPIEVQVSEDKVVDFNQLLKIDSFANNGLTRTKVNDYVYTFTNDSGSDISNPLICYFTGFNTQLGHVYYFPYIVGSYNVRFFSPSELALAFSPNSNTDTASDSFTNITRFYYIGTILNGSSVDIRFNLYDLTQLYGAGNEDLVSTFNTYFTASYYDYVLSKPVLLPDFDVVTYNDNDIGSQMVYTMYQGVNKYFNFDSVFNFADLYSWLNLTFFNGAAPLGFFIFWHLLIYWLLISLLWLLFDVLIYVPLLIHRWLDKASLI